MRNLQPNILLRDIKLQQKDKVKWDETALEFALKINDGSMQTNYPSLYLNIAKCYEDLNDFDAAGKNYETALSYANNLPDDGYGTMIRVGITNGMERISLRIDEYKKDNNIHLGLF